MTSAEDSAIFAGVEGGATHSTLVLIDSKGQKLGQWPGPALNCLLNGVERTADQISAWVQESVMQMSQVKLPIKALGMGLSGAEEASSKERMLQHFRSNHADLASNFFLTSDSVCAAATAFDKGGVVLIAGTGSACCVIKENGSVHSVGGLGHLIGDGGSGFWISMKAVRKVFDDDDGLAKCEFETKRVKEEILRHFQLKDKMELLNLLYGERFNKLRIASFCAVLASIADVDKLSANVFLEAGEILARHILAASRHFDQDMFEDLPILAIGSVFNSWPLLKQGFADCFRRHYSTSDVEGNRIKKISIFQLEESGAIGAALLGQRRSQTSDQSLACTRSPDGDHPTAIRSNRKLFDQIQL